MQYNQFNKIIHDDLKLIKIIKDYSSIVISTVGLPGGGGGVIP